MVVSTRDQSLGIHLGLVVEDDVDAGPGGLLQYPVFPLEAFVEVGALQRRQQPHHGHGNAGFLYEVDLGVEHPFVVSVQAQDESAADLQPLPLNGANGAQQIVLLLLLVGVLRLLGLEQGLGIGSLDSQEHPVETGLDHGVHQFVVSGQVDAGFGKESEGIAALLLPLGHHGKKFQRLPLVADEVVVHQEDVAPPTQLIEGVELTQHLLRRLGPRHSAEELGDVAELAVEGAPPGELQAHRVVVLHVDEVKARGRRAGHIGFLRRPVGVLGGSGLKVPQELGQDLLDFIQQEVVHPLDLVVIGGGVGPSGHYRNAGPVAALDHGVQGIALNDHGGGKHHVGPLQVRILQGGHIQIHHAEVVPGGEHAGNGEETESRKPRLLSYKFQGKLSAPVGRRKFRVN